MDNSYSDVTGLLTGRAYQRDYYLSAIGAVGGTPPTSDEKDDAKFAKISFISSDLPADCKSPNCKMIFPFPNELSTFISNDDSFVLDDSEEKSTFDKFLESIPYAQIRAYVPDTIFQFVQGILDAAEDGIRFALDALENNESIGKKFLNEIELAFTNIEDFFVQFFNAQARNTFTQKFKDELGNKFKVYKSSDSNGEITIGEGTMDFQILDFPYLLFYKVLGATTNAIYKIPCQFPSSFLESDGSFGWNGDKNDIKNLLLASASSSNSESLSFMQKTATGLLGLLTSKMNMCIMPFFNPSNASGNADGVEIKFDLINDTFEHAEANFAFVQTLIANNKWLQNTIVSNPANLYDVKIPGGHRLFICKGIFTISLKGAVRTLNNNANLFKPFEEETRIPEAYSISLKFESLIPNNFNTYMIGLIKSNEDLFNYNTGIRFEENAIDKFSNSFAAAAKEMNQGYTNMQNVIANALGVNRDSSILLGDFYATVNVNDSDDLRAAKEAQNAAAIQIAEKVLAERKAEIDNILIKEIAPKQLSDLTTAEYIEEVKKIVEKEELSTESVSDKIQDELNNDENLKTLMLNVKDLENQQQPTIVIQSSS